MKEIILAQKKRVNDNYQFITAKTSMIPQEMVIMNYYNESGKMK